MIAVAAAFMGLGGILFFLGGMAWVNGDTRHDDAYCLKTAGVGAILVAIGIAIKVAL